jgi:hypothetical protein
MSPEPSTLALVESPVQLLHVIEWCAWHQTRNLQVAVLSPREGHGRVQLAAMRRIAEKSGLEVVWLDPRLSWGGSLWSWAGLRRRAAAVDQVLVGDPFSGLIQAILTTSRVGKLVVVDDGTATIDFADSLVGDAPLLRWAVRSGGVSRLVRSALARRTTRALRRLGPESLEVFTAMPVDLRAWATVTHHGYAWTRGAFGPPEVRDQVAVIGSSLVESGLLSEDAYVSAITDAMASVGETSGVYIRHRRESTAKLRRLVERTGLSLVSSDVPLELELRRGPVGRHVVCFPSTPAFTLPLVLDGSGAELTVVPLDPSVLNPAAESRARDFLLRLSAQARGTGSADLDQAG